MGLAEMADVAERIYRGSGVGIPTAMGNSATVILKALSQGFETKTSGSLSLKTIFTSKLSCLNA